MKKLIIFTVFFFTLFPVWRTDGLQLYSPQQAYAQNTFGNELPEVKICGRTDILYMTDGKWVCGVAVDCVTGAELSRNCHYEQDLGDADGSGGDDDDDDDDDDSGDDQSGGSGGGSSGGGGGSGHGQICNKILRERKKNGDGIWGTLVTTQYYYCTSGFPAGQNTYAFEPDPAPCGGNVVANPTLTASSAGNFKGGTFGFTRRREDGSPRHHDGIDITATAGSNVYTMYGGTITRINKSLAPDAYVEDSYGNYVEVRSVINGQTVFLKYNHLDGVVSALKVGDPIQKGTVMGISGTTGNASSKNPKTKTKVTPHVHIQAKNASYEKVDPAQYMTTKFSTTTGQPINPCN